MLSLSVSKEIIEGCRRNERSSQEALYKLCYSEFMKICLRYTETYDDAANVLHDAFIKILTKMNAVKNTSDAVGWMKRIVVNTCIDHIRLKKNLNQVSMEGLELPNEPVEDHFVVDENTLLAMIRSLPQSQAAVFNLFVMENHSHNQISEMLNITVANSKWHLFDARKILKEKVSLFLKQNEKANGSR